MARRLMSRRGGSASQPQVTPYQQLELDDKWREWENTKQELGQVKRQLTEKDALVLQLKTTARRLQETLRKKDKDLQAAFAILRSPQDAKTTKTRKQELMDRLVAESMQRAVAAEALVEERGRELNRLKYNSKFLRFQELEVEIEECHFEIERLRTKLETAVAGSPVVAGKLKVSTVQNSVGGSAKKTNPTSASVMEDGSPESNMRVSVPTRLSPIPSQSARGVGQVRVVPLGKYDQREGFVSKTRRRAAEAEYYKQVRLAQLEVECELEENLHIRAAREAKKVQFAQERQVKLSEKAAEPVPVTLELVAAESSPACGKNTDDTSRLQPVDDREGSTRIKAGKEKESVSITAPRSEVNTFEISDIKAKRTNADSQPAELDACKNNQGSIDYGAVIEGYTGSGENLVSQKPATLQQINNKDIANSLEGLKDDKTEEIDEPEEVRHRDREQGHQSSERVPGNQQMYDDDEFNGSDDDSISDPDGAKNHDANDNERSIWNVDPTPKNIDQPRDDEEIRRTQNDATDEVQNITENSERGTVWNVDPNPSDPAPLPTEIKPSQDSNTDRVIWNVDPNPGAPGKLDSEDVHSEEESVSVDSPASNDDDNMNKVWNVDPSPAAPTDDDPVNISPTNEVEEHYSPVHDAEDDSTNNARVWNVDPNPGAPQSLVSPEAEEVTFHEAAAKTAVWNLNLNPLPAVNSSPLSSNVDVADEPSSHYVGESNEIWNLDPNPLPAVSSSPLSFNVDVADEPSSHSAGESNENWNLDPNHLPAVSSSPLSSNVDVADEHSSHSVGESNEENNANSPWNLDPNLASHPSGVPDDKDDRGSRTDLSSDVNLPVQTSTNELPSISHDEHVVENDTSDVLHEANASGAWNLDPSPSASAPTESKGDNEGCNVDETQDRPVWNLDPHTSDFSAPNQGDTADPPDVTFADSDDEDAATPRSIEDDTPNHDSEENDTAAAANDENLESVHDVSTFEPTSIEVESTKPTPQLLYAHEKGNTSPALSNAGDAPPEKVDDAASDHIDENSPQEGARADNYTPDYTPPSTARDSDAAADEEDTSW